MKKTRDLIVKLDHYDIINGVATNGFGILKYLKLSGNFTDKSLIIKDNGLNLFDPKRENNALQILNADLIKHNRNYKPSGTVIFFSYGSPRKDKIPFEASHFFDELAKAIRIVTCKKCELIYHFTYDKSKKPIEFHKSYDFINENRDYYSAYADNSDISNKALLRTIQKVFKNLIKLPLDNGINHTPLLNAVRFLNHAQHEAWLNLKITLFFIALESIFSMDNNEISYKVSLRASYFLFPKNKEKRNRVFTVLRNGYDLRSGFVHGLKRNENKIAQKLKVGVSDYSMMHDFPDELNSIVCEIMKKILITDGLFELFSNATTSERENYLSSLVL